MNITKFLLLLVLNFAAVESMRNAWFYVNRTLPSREPQPIMGNASPVPHRWNVNIKGKKNQIKRVERPTSTKITSTECGLRPLNRQRRITGGQTSTFGDWPWQVSVMRNQANTFPRMHRCGGVLLNSLWVVTSAHCVYKFHPNSLRIRLGEHDFHGSWEPQRHIDRSVKRVIIHSQYNRQTLENDIALLRMDQPVSMKDHIMPICLPPTDDLLTGKPAIVTGWGRTKDYGALPPVLQEVNVRIISNERCESLFRQSGHYERISGGFICTDYLNHRPASHCQGDSGGPLQLQKQDGRWFLAGIVSWGIGCSQSKLPSVYIRISNFRGWLQRNMV